MCFCPWTDTMNFIYTMLPLVNIIQKHNIYLHCYADDTKLFLLLKPDELGKIQACLEGRKTWMTDNFWRLHSDNTMSWYWAPGTLKLHYLSIPLFFMVSFWLPTPLLEILKLYLIRTCPVTPTSSKYFSIHPPII